MAQAGYGEAAMILKRIEDVLRDRGFEFSQSSLGDARYWTKPGVALRIRTATYCHRHPDTVDIVVTPTRAREITLNAAEITAMVECAITDAGAATNEDEDEDFVLPTDIQAALARYR